MAQDGTRGSKDNNSSKEEFCDLSCLGLAEAFLAEISVALLLFLAEPPSF
ncbi:predicted protein [Histoplasma mississippiense (nom. inval.)]|nr:predicted protein [Histoplasma mississippiense (nom. inval.)]EDN09021.1 predicted protein [Histoplasma mississippiense (nom. inval.)]